MRGKPNNGLATTITALVVGIAVIGAIEVSGRNYAAYNKTRSLPDMAEFERAATIDVTWPYRSEEYKKEVKGRYIAVVQEKAMKEWQDRIGVDVMKLMGCGLFAAFGVYLGRVIRGRQPDNGSWRGR